VNGMDTSFERDGRELCATMIKVHAQLRIPLQSSITIGDKLETCCNKRQVDMTRSGTVFTTLDFLRNVRIDPIS
jgi:hypothetical protein